MTRERQPKDDFDDILGIEEPEPEPEPGDGELDGDGVDDGDDDGTAAIAEWIDSLDGDLSRGPSEDEDGEELGGVALDSGMDLVGDDDEESAAGDGEPTGDLLDQWDDLVGDDSAEEVSGEDREQPLELDDDWFLDDDCLTDDGDWGDGPLEDGIDEIDEDGWSDLDEPGDEDGDGISAERADARLEAEALAEIEGRRPATRLDRGVAVDLAFLGPRTGSAVAIAVRGGAPVAVGDEVFVLGADGMLHGVREGLPDDVTSVCLLGDGIIVGTAGAGAWRYDHPAARPLAINGWLSRDSGPGADPGITTSIEVFAGNRAHAPLFGLTGEGQLFASRDFGDHWAGPLTSGPCLAAAADEDSGELAALVSGSDGVYLARGMPGHLRSVRITDGEVEALLRGGPLRMAAAGAQVAVIPSAPGAALLVSRGGEELVSLVAAAGTTAVALDGDDPDWIAVGLADPEGDRAEIRISDDGGRSFRSALILERVGEAGSPVVTALAVDVGTTTKLWVVTGRGIYRMVLRQRTRGH